MRPTPTAAAALALALLAGAPAAGAGGWTGCYAGVQGGYAMANHDVDVGGVVAVDGIGGEGFEGGPLIGCDLQIGDRFVVGALADYAFRDVETSASAFGSGVSVGLTDAWSVGARAGFLVTPTTLVYALAAFQHTEVDDAGSGLLSSLEGIAVGGGLETELAAGWALRGEYRFVAYDGETIAGVVGIETDEQQGRIGLVYRFH